MKVRLCVVCLAGSIAVSVLSAADAPYIGKWKLNPAKSQFKGQTVLIEKTPDGGFHVHQNDLDFTFKLDGKEYPTPDGGTIL